MCKDWLKEKAKAHDITKQTLSKARTEDNTNSVVKTKVASKTYPHLAVLDPVTYCYRNIEMILVQDVYHAIRPLDYFAADEKCLSFAARLPIGWVLCGALPWSSG